MCYYQAAIISLNKFQLFKTACHLFSPFFYVVFLSVWLGALFYRKEFLYILFLIFYSQVWCGRFTSNLFIGFFTYISLLQLTNKHIYTNVNNTSYGVRTDSKSLESSSHQGSLAGTGKGVTTCTGCFKLTLDLRMALFFISALGSALSMFRHFPFPLRLNLLHLSLITRNLCSYTYSKFLLVL